MKVSQKPWKKERKYKTRVVSTIDRTLPIFLVKTRSPVKTSVFKFNSFIPRPSNTRRHAPKERKYVSCLRKQSEELQARLTLDLPDAFLNDNVQMEIMRNETNMLL